MVCIDIQSYGTTQAKERPDIVNVGAGEGYWVKTIENVKICLRH